MRSLLRRPLFWLACAAVLAAAVFVVLRARGPMVRSTVVEARALEQHIVASGRVWVPTRAQVSTQVPGLVVAVGAVEGQRVKAGDLLVQIDDSEARAAVAQAQAAYRRALRPHDHDHRRPHTLKRLLAWEALEYGIGTDRVVSTADDPPRRDRF